MLSARARAAGLLTAAPLLLAGCGTEPAPTTPRADRLAGLAAELHPSMARVTDGREPVLTPDLWHLAPDGSARPLSEWTRVLLDARHLAPGAPRATLEVVVDAAPDGAGPGWLEVRAPVGPSLALEPDAEGRRWRAELPRWAIGEQSAGPVLRWRSPDGWRVRSISIEAGAPGATVGLALPADRPTDIGVLTDATESVRVELGDGGPVEAVWVGPEAGWLGNPRPLRPGASTVLQPPAGADAARLGLTFLPTDAAHPPVLTGLTQRLERSRPNLVLLVVDTLRADRAVDARGEPLAPGFAAFARGGVSYPRAFSHTATTLPSHTSLFSGRLPHETGVTFNGQLVPDDLPLLADWLRAAGYHTRALTSIAPLSPHPDQLGLLSGFDVFDDDLVAFPDAASALGRLDGHLAALEALDRPWFLFLHLSDPHSPYLTRTPELPPVTLALDGEPLEEFTFDGFLQLDRAVSLPPGARELSLESAAPIQVTLFTLFDEALEHAAARRPEVAPRRRHALDVSDLAHGEFWLRADVSDVPDLEQIRARYADEVAVTSRALEGIHERLDARGLLDDTVTVLTSDHGEGLGDHGAVGHGRAVFDEQIHVPLLVRPAPGDARLAELAAGRDAVVSHVDVAPTVCDLLGLPPLPDAAGRSLLAGGSGVHLAATSLPGAPRTLCLRDGRTKLVLLPDDGDHFVQFDLRADPGETRDVHDPDDASLEAWRERLRAAAADATEPRWAELTEDRRRALENLGYVVPDAPTAAGH